MKIQRTMTIFFSCIFLLGGCATGSSIVTGNARSAIRSTEVKVYLDPPAQYEIIGIVEASSAVEFSTQAAQDRVIEELKLQAAKIGANGVLLMNIGNNSTEQDEIKTAQGRAIYVFQ